MQFADDTTPTGWLATWEASAIKAMQDQPLYFARWYTVKSVALALSLGALGYLLCRRRV